MRNKKLKKYISIVTILISMVSAMSALAYNNETVGQVENLVDGIVGYKLDSSGSKDVQAWIDGELSANAGVTSEWFVLGLSQSGDYDFAEYKKALLAYLENNTVYSASSRLKYALLLAATGSNDIYISKTLEDSIGNQGIMSYVYGLHMLNNGYTSSKHTKESVVEKLLDLQLSDGGWAITGASGDVDATAMVIQSLAPYYKNDNNVKAAVDKGLERLSNLQNDEGDYSSYGVPNPESTAQVLVALSALNIDCYSDTRFIKNENTIIDGLKKYQLQDGSFCHKEGEGSNNSATVQAFYSLVSYIRMCEEKSGLYILDNCNTKEVTPNIPSNIPSNIPTEEGTTENIKTKSGEYKLPVVVVLIGIGLVSSMVMYLCGKRNKKNFIAIAILSSIAVLFVCFTDFKSKDEYYNGEALVKEDVSGSVTLTIRCDTIADITDSEYIPGDGVILDVTEFDIEEGDTVYDILVEATRQYNIQMESSGAEAMVYISGINYLYEFDYGDLSGWMYFVNDEEANVGCNSYKLGDGDKIEWLYTCNLGEDLK